jgi:uncharacterized protein (TIGR03437 family)
VYSERANKIGYYYHPEHDFVIDEPGIYTVDVRVTFDGVTSAGQTAEPFPTGDVLGSVDGRFFVYAVPRGSAPLEVDAVGMEFTARAAAGHATTVIPGFLLETGKIAGAGGQFRYRFDPDVLARDFPNLDLPLADVVAISLFDPDTNRARVLVYHGEEFFQTAQTPVRPVAAAVVNAASFTAPVAAGGLATVFGENLASLVTSAAALPLPTTLGGATVTLNGVPAPLAYTSPTQINFQVPWELAGQGEATLVVSSGAPINVPLAPLSPGIFAVVQQGRYLILYCTGLGGVTNPPASGAAALADPLSNTVATPTVTVGGQPARVFFSGLAPGFAGLYQVNVELPPINGTVLVELTAGATVSNAVTVSIQ